MLFILFSENESTDSFFSLANQWEQDCNLGIFGFQPQFSNLSRKRCDDKSLMGTLAVVLLKIYMISFWLT